VDALSGANRPTVKHSKAGAGRAWRRWTARWSWCAGPN
jgi:hypothetical protein